MSMANALTKTINNPGKRFAKFLDNTGAGIGDLVEQPMLAVAAGMDEIAGVITEIPGEFITNTMIALTDALPTFIALALFIVLVIVIISRMFKVNMKVPGLGSVSN